MTCRRSLPCARPRLDTRQRLARILHSTTLGSGTGLLLLLLLHLAAVLWARLCILHT